MFPPSLIFPAVFAVLELPVHELAVFALPVHEADEPVILIPHVPVALEPFIAGYALS